MESRLCIGTPNYSSLFREVLYEVVCYHNGKPLNKYISWSRRCKSHALHDVSKFGSYHCRTWTTNPIRLLKSNSIMIQNNRMKSYVAIMSITGENFSPKLHDSTFYRKQNSFLGCEGILVTLLGSVFSRVKLQKEYSLSTEHNFFAKNKQNGGLREYIHFEIDEELVDFIESNKSSLISAKVAYNKKCSLLQIKPTDGCPLDHVDHPYIKRGLTFDATTEAGNFLPRELCVTENFMPLTRACHGDYFQGYEWGVITDQCIKDPPEQTRLLHEVSNKINETTLRSLATISSNTDILYPVDVQLVSSALDALFQNKTKNLGSYSDLVRTIDNVMSYKSSNYSLIANKLNTTNRILSSFEKLAFKVESSGEPYATRENREFISAERVDVSENRAVTGYAVKRSREASTLTSELLSKENINTAIILPNNYVSVLDDYQRSSKLKENFHLVFTVYRNSKLFIDVNQGQNKSVNSHIAQVSFHNVPFKNLSEPVKIILTPLRNNSGKSVCVYWDFELNHNYGGWSTEGCITESSSEDVVTCSCDHLTSFALLLYGEVNEGHTIVLGIITQIGCALSMFGLLMVFLTFVLFDKWRRNLANKVVFNLAVAIFGSLVVFIFGINQTQNDILCRTMAVLLHYFILASFGWMMIEGVILYYRMVKVYNTHMPSRFLWKASIFSWGLPLLPILALLIYDKSFYGSTNSYNPGTYICWLSYGGFLYGFLPPLGLTMSVNAILFYLILRGPAFFGKSNVRSNISERSMLINQFSMVAFAFFLMGFTWLFGLFTIFGFSLTFSYLFCIFNSLQGFFIFFLQICFAKSSKLEWKEYIRILLRDPNFTGDYSSSNIHPRSDNTADNRQKNLFRGKRSDEKLTTFSSDQNATLLSSKGVTSRTDSSIDVYL